MPKYTNPDQMSPMSVIHGGNTYIVPPGKTIVVPDEVAVVEEVAAPSSAPQEAFPTDARKSDEGAPEKEQDKGEPDKATPKKPGKRSRASSKGGK